jgi:hypothetical protein
MQKDWARVLLSLYNSKIEKEFLESEGKLFNYEFSEIDTVLTVSTKILDFKGIQILFSIPDKYPIYEPRIS